ncbi:CPBP family intramembrane glutamic endopeptidase [Enemella sp. A6]|uniref:CPBP family intramembrane glutamic endopeptidase n=1 Tax=Enemella sp. A6 TaxID=3440152 RepID=UPI003EBDCC77
MTSPTDPAPESAPKPSTDANPAERAARAERTARAEPAEKPGRPRPGIEVWVVLGVTFGQSAVYAILRLTERLTRPEALARQQATMNSSAVPERPWLDLLYQIANIGFGLMPVVLVLYLLHLSHGRPFATIGFDLRRPARDLLVAVGLAAAIGIPGLGVYLIARELGLSTQIVAANLAENWWTIPVLIGAAFMNGAAEEVVMVGWLFTRLRQLQWRWPVVIITSALIRGSYHLYQGPGMAVGNVLMGIVLGLVYWRWRRVMPLVICHTLLDIFAFVGYALLAPHLSWL